MDDRRSRLSIGMHGKLGVGDLLNLALRDPKQEVI